MSNLSLFRKKGKPITRKRGDLLFRQGEFDASVYVVEEGLLKAYYLTSEGKELIKSFIREGEYIGSLVACTSSEACTFSLACLEDCSLLRIPFAELQAQAAKDAESAASVIQSLMDLAIKKERREYEFLCLPAPERYALFQQRSPELLGRLTQNDIARYLGITPVALSRIRHRANS